jgi:transketolase
VVATLEEHSRIGGLGGAVAEWRADHDGARAVLLRLGTPDEFLHEAGDEHYARSRFGLTSAHIASAVEEALRRSDGQVAARLRPSVSAGAM